MVKFTNQGVAEVGYVAAKDVPVLKPIDDLFKISAAPRIAMGIDAVESSFEKVNDVLFALSSFAHHNGYSIVSKTNAQTESMRLKVLSEALDDVEAVVLRKSTDPYREFILNQIASSQAAINQYVRVLLTSDSDKKLSDCLLDNMVSKFIFDKFSNRSSLQEITNKSLIEILFPKRISKGLYLLKEEIVAFKGKPAFAAMIKELEPLIPDARDGDKIPLLPFNYGVRIHNFEDLPKQSDNYSIAVNTAISKIELAFVNSEPVLIDDKYLNDHSKNLGVIDLVEDKIQDLPEGFIFKKEDPDPRKVQYLKFLKEKYPEKLCWNKTYRIPLIKAGDGKAHTKSAFLFRTSDFPDTLQNQDDLKKVRAALGFKPKEMKLVNYAANSSLSTKSLRLVAALTKGKAPESFVKNVKGFLGSFLNQELMDMAAERMMAAIEQKRTILEDHEEDDKNDEDVTPLTM